jgi:hypothetical protein
LNELIIDKNSPEALMKLMHKSLYLPIDYRWYAQIPSEGENRYKFLNIFEHDADVAIPPAQKKLFIETISVLTKGALTMNMEGIAAINTKLTPGIHVRNMVENFNPKYLIFWGANPEHSGLSMQEFSGTYYNKVKVACLPSLEQVAEDSNTKTRCENFLKMMFGIK